jgi:hypothetical protein
MVVIILFRIFTIRLPDMITNGVQIDFPDRGVKFTLATDPPAGAFANFGLGI